MPPGVGGSALHPRPKRSTSRAFAARDAPATAASLASKASRLDGGGRHNEESGGASGGAEIRICGSTMSKPKWARHNGKWGPVKPDFWRIWHANKELLKKNGYEVRRNDNGQYEVRYIPPPKWPPVGASPILVPEGMKASICFKCGHVRLIKMTDEHKACGLCGATLD